MHDFCIISAYSTIYQDLSPVIQVDSFKMFKPHNSYIVSNLNSISTLTRLFSGICVYSNQLVQEGFYSHFLCRKGLRPVPLPSLLMNMDVKNRILNTTETPILISFQINFFLLSCCGHSCLSSPVLLVIHSSINEVPIKNKSLSECSNKDKDL